MPRCLPSFLTRAAAVALLATTAVQAAAQVYEIPLTVQESAGVARQVEPISGGVPLPAGRFGPDQPFRLVRADGSEVPCQVTPLVVDPRPGVGGLRWVLLDFQDDVAAGATNRYVLQAAAPAAKPPAAIKVQEGPEGIAVDTGRIRFTISTKKPFGLFDSVTVGGKAVVGGGEVTCVQMLGRKGWDDKTPWQSKTRVAGPPERLSIRYAGPMRVTIEAAGHFQDDPAGAGYRASITAWAGSGRALVKYSLTNSNPDRYTAILVGRSAIELKTPGGGDLLLGAAKPLTAPGDAWIHQGLRPDRAGVGAAKAGQADKTLWTSAGPKDPPAGWIARPGGVFVCDMLFSTAPARRLAAEGGRMVLEGIAPAFKVPADEKSRRALPWQAEGFWLYDCSHHTSEYLFDFAPPAEPQAMDALSRAARNRLWVLAPGQHYSTCEVLGTGRFGTLADEMACYKAWGWAWKDKQVPDASRPVPGAFVGWEDNHYESEADSVQGLLLQYLRTGQRGWLDLAEGWARYHMDLQAWRTDGWRWKDGAIWFPSGGPQGNLRVRQDWNFAWGPDWGNRKGNPDCYDLWRHAQAKSCYCHFYGSGLADWFCLTGDRDALEAAIDDVEQKDDEFRRHSKFEPGKTPIGSIRGFGRGFEVMVRVLMADPSNAFVAETCHLAARTLRESPILDERGFHPSHVGGGFSGMKAKDLSPNVRKWMKDRGITFTTEGDTVDTLTKDGRTWPARCFGGTWQHVYVQNGADLYARHFDDDDMRDFVIAFAHMSRRYMLSPKCHQTWYYTYFDVPDFGMVYDPWAFDHTDTTDGEGCVHSGWYTRFFPDTCARGFSWTGERPLLEKAREFWRYGSKRQYQTKNLFAGPGEAGMFAGHVPPKDDQVLSVSRLLEAWSHPPKDAEPPAAIRDLAVRPLGDGKAEVHFTAPADAGGGRVARYQVKAAALPIVAYDQWDYARDLGTKRNWWMATNLAGEPAPAKPGAAERFVVTGVPDGKTLHFAVRTFDDSSNRSALSNVVVPAGP